MNYYSYIRYTPACKEFLFVENKSSTEDSIEEHIRKRSNHWEKRTTKFSDFTSKDLNEAKHIWYQSGKLITRFDYSIDEFLQKCSEYAML